jgi:hypothetical protein
LIGRSDSGIWDVFGVFAIFVLLEYMLGWSNPVKLFLRNTKIKEVRLITF